jgi:hypothetical protein
MARLIDRHSVLPYHEIIKLSRARSNMTKGSVNPASVAKYKIRSIYQLIHGSCRYYAIVRLRLRLIALSKRMWASSCSAWIRCSPGNRIALSIATGNPRCRPRSITAQTTSLLRVCQPPEKLYI